MRKKTLQQAIDSSNPGDLIIVTERGGVKNLGARCKMSMCLNTLLPHHATCSPEHRIQYRREYQRQWWHRKGKKLANAKKPKKRDPQKWNEYHRNYYRKKKEAGRSLV